MFTLLMEALAQMFYFTGYIRSQSFAKPLSKEEEERCIALLAEKDREAREKLIEHNLRLVAHIVKKYDIKKTQTDDLISIGTIGLIKAVDSFRPEMGKKLTTYASRCIENEILMYLRKTSQLRNEISIDEPLNVDWDGNELLFSDILGSDSDIVDRGIEHQAECDMLLQSVNKLPEREREIMSLRFGLNGKKEHTQKQVADKLGISQSYISRLEKRIINKLKREMERVV